MHLLCISASNIQHAQNHSTSLKVCKLIQQIIFDNYSNKVETDIIPLVNYELRPCNGCGTCFQNGRCSSDTVFNELYEHLIHGDGLFIVSPHYAPIPAKLCMLLEKIEQLAFLPRFNDKTHRSPLYKLPVGIIGHGGGTDDVVELYKGQVLDTISNALSWPVEMTIMKDKETFSSGVVFPVKEIRHTSGSIFPIHEYDWEDIKRRIEPLIHKVIERAGIE